MADFKQIKTDIRQPHYQKGSMGYAEQKYATRTLIGIAILWIILFIVSVSGNNWIHTAVKRAPFIANLIGLIIAFPVSYGVLFYLIKAEPKRWPLYGLVAILLLGGGLFIASGFTLAQ